MDAWSGRTSSGMPPQWTSTSASGRGPWQVGPVSAGTRRSHGPALYGPALYGPALYGPALYGPAQYGSSAEAAARDVRAGRLGEGADHDRSIGLELDTRGDDLFDGPLLGRRHPLDFEGLTQ